MDVKRRFIELLQDFGYPVILQGSLSQDEAYPDSFFTFWNNSTNDAAFFDNAETVTVWDFDCNFYSIDPVLVNAIMKAVKRSLKNNGFIVDGVGYDVVSDEPTHTGRGLEVIYLERVN